jgi:hypothetical protein
MSILSSPVDAVLKSNKSFINAINNNAQASNNRLKTDVLQSKDHQNRRKQLAKNELQAKLIALKERRSKQLTDTHTDINHNDSYISDNESVNSNITNISAHIHEENNNDILLQANESLNNMLSDLQNELGVKYEYINENDDASDNSDESDNNNKHNNKSSYINRNTLASFRNNDDDNSIDSDDSYHHHVSKESKKFQSVRDLHNHIIHHSEKNLPTTFLDSMTTSLMDGEVVGRRKDGMVDVKLQPASRKDNQVI